PLLIGAVLAVTALGIRVARAGAADPRLFPLLALGLVTAMIAVNKVGSPQFACWLAVPVIAGLVGARAFRAPAAMVLAIAALTQVVYPYLYDQLVALAPWMLVVLTLRNALYLLLLGWTLRELWRLGSAARAGEPAST